RGERYERDDGIHYRAEHLREECVERIEHDIPSIPTRRGAESNDGYKKTPRMRGVSVGENLGAGCRRRRKTVIRAGVVSELERTKQDVYEAPDGNHKEEADNAVEHEGAAGIALFLVMTTLDEVEEHAPDEYDEREREDDRHEHVVDDADDGITE